MFADFFHNQPHRIPSVLTTVNKHNTDADLPHNTNPATETSLRTSIEKAKDAAAAAWVNEDVEVDRCA